MTGKRKPATPLVRRTSALLLAGGLALGLVIGTAATASADLPPEIFDQTVTTDLTPDLQEGNWNSTGS
ncbi:hypothetical protein MTF65_17450 [Streptomyces sp. APSN-46.1]|uniref:hypothetical protein n=1 Tax=Streptomyces sp. APSN-46.1 TaxID=2929049 RepID=UPI001FB2C2AF|nr:hypothetical protein [Streptomyces sp. APSN-46.1]MCJ1679091.1 hypothetical protein [Streptomyces sp. APSN-46.1]